MPQLDAQAIQDVVTEVLSRLGESKTVDAQRPPAPKNGTGSFSGSGDAAAGRFTEVDDAVEAATDSYHQLQRAGLDVRDRVCHLIKQIAVDNARAWGEYELNETRLGRLDHKVAKLELLKNVPGVEFLRAHASVAHSGDEGIGIDEAAAWGVIGVITPVTHSIPTMTANAINMIAAGNTMVVNAHPSGAKSAALAAETYNRAIKQRFGLDPLVCVMDPPTLRTAEQIFSHQDIPLLVATGGPAVARAAMKQPKRSVVAGPGNPPVVVDETADLARAAESIIAGAAFDNNLLCIGEKEVFVVESVFDAMMQAMEKAGAARLTAPQVAKLTDKAFAWQKDHHAVVKEYIGADLRVLAAAAEASVPAGCELLFGETDESNPFVPEEQMMPFVPFVRVRDFDQGLELALKHEHGFGHTAIIHSHHLARITEMGRAMNTTIFVANGPCTAGLGIGGEGYPSYSIATPTGEGITNPLTFTRFRRLSMSSHLRIV